MMKFVCRTTEPYSLKTLVSLNPIMVDGTGMCGGCRVTVERPGEVRLRWTALTLTAIRWTLTS